MLLLQAYGWLLARIETLRASNERGAAAVEYGLLVALVAAVIITAVTALGTKVQSVFCVVVTALPFGPAVTCP